MKRINRYLKYACDLKDDFIKTHFSIVFYDYQKNPSDAILKRILKHEGGTIPVEFSRQSGKTTMLVYLIVFIAVHIFPLGDIFNYPFRKVGGKPVFTIIIFAPVLDQAKTDFDAIKKALNTLRMKYEEKVCLDSAFKIEEEERNANTLILENGVTIHVYSLSPNSHPESKTGDVLVYEEAQHIQDHRLENVAEPMGVATNALEIFVGTAGYERCRFFTEITEADRKKKELFIAERDTVVKSKRKRYEEDGDPFHLNYEKKTSEIISNLGENNEAVKTQYLLVWVTGSGMFIESDEILFDLQGTYDEVLETDEPVFLFIDWGKSNSRTVATFMNRKCWILSWEEHQGEKYNEQWEQIARKCQFYSNLQRIGMDSTGTQDAQLDWITADIKEKNKRLDFNLPIPEGIDFTMKNKDIMYRKLWYLCHDTTVDEKVVKYSQLRFPRTDTTEKKRFIFEMLWLQKDIVQQRYWSCHKPEGDKYGDDYPDSAAGAIALVLDLLEFFKHESAMYEDAGVLFV